jgi:hypothetical protein
MRNFRQEFHFDTSFAVRLQPAKQDVPRVCEFGGPRADSVVQPVLTSPLEHSEYARYLGQQVPVTFVIDVPLEIVVGGDIASFILDVAFAAPVLISELQYRAVGASFEDFEAKYCGRVHLQVMCALDVVAQTGQ